MHNPIRRYACYALTAVVDLVLPCTDRRAAPTVRLPWRYRVRRWRQVFPEDVPGPWVSDRELTTAERLARESGEAVPTSWRRIGE